MSEEEMEKEENLEHEVLDRLKLLNKEDFDTYYLDESYIDAMLKARNIILKLYKKKDKVIDRLSNLVIIKSLKPNGEHTNCTYDFDYNCKLNEEGYRKYSCKDCVKKYYFEEVMKDE